MHYVLHETVLGEHMDIELRVAPTSQKGMFRCEQYNDSKTYARKIRRNSSSEERQFKRKNAK